MILINFLKRNIPVFMIGLATIVIFVVIIIIASRIKVTGPAMILLGDSEEANQATDTVQRNEINQTTTPKISETSETTKSVSDYKQILLDQKYGVISIDYTEQGFIPNNIKAVVGQRVVFKNTTRHDITIQQVIRLYDELATPVLLKPQDTLEIKLTKEKLWTFKEKSIKHYGSIFTVAQ